MSNQIKDQIADDAIMLVATLNDDQVIKKISINYNIKAWDWAKALKKNGIKRADTLAGKVMTMDNMRDLLTVLVFDDLMSTPGPHG